LHYAIFTQSIRTEICVLNPHILGYNLRANAPAGTGDGAARPRMKPFRSKTSLKGNEPVAAQGATPAALQFAIQLQSQAGYA
jgi:hypothetical protein